MQVHTKHQNLLERSLPIDVSDLLSTFIKSYNNGSPPNVYWERYYEFICHCFGKERLARPSVSQLAEILKKQGISKPGTFAVVYAHSLFTLAKHSKGSIYRDDFNI